MAISCEKMSKFVICTCAFLVYWTNSVNGEYNVSLNESKLEDVDALRETILAKLYTMQAEIENARNIVETEAISIKNKNYLEIENVIKNNMNKLVLDDKSNNQATTCYVPQKRDDINNCHYRFEKKVDDFFSVIDGNVVFIGRKLNKIKTNFTESCVKKQPETLQETETCDLTKLQTNVQKLMTKRLNTLKRNLTKYKNKFDKCKRRVESIRKKQLEEAKILPIQLKRFIERC